VPGPGGPHRHGRPAGPHLFLVPRRRDDGADLRHADRDDDLHCDRDDRLRSEIGLGDDHHSRPAGDRQRRQ
jgi:hypothetical protein